MARMARRLTSAIALAGVLCFILTLHVAAQRRAVASVAPQDLARIWDAEHVSPELPPLLDHDEVEERLKVAVTRAPSRYFLEKAGDSLEGRSINLLTVGQGPFRVLLWSQMHGDEPTATAALFDVFEYFHRHATDPAVQRIMSSLTMYFVPMLNPDGAERFQRRNAQGIDINRDALRLQTPEGRTLKGVRDRFNPRVGFNLHNQNWSTSVGDPPKPASISLLSVAYDKARSENAGRKLTKRLCAVIRDALEPFASGQIGRYDDEFEGRAFGDNLTLWGTPVVLIETGAYPSSQPDAMLVRLNFIAIVSALDALATGNVGKADPERYETLPMNDANEFYVLLRNATVMTGTGVPAFTADIGINVNRRVRTENGQRLLQVTSTINDLGDLRTYDGLRTIDATNRVVAPLFDPSLKEGQKIELPDWAKQPSARVIAPGQSGEVVLLRPLEESGRSSRYVVDTILRY